MAKLTDDELLAICEAEINDIESEGDLNEERTRNLDYYHGDMDEYLPAGKDRSSVVTRDALDTVESVLPSLLKIFIDAENAVEFVPEGPEDEAQAEMETKAVRNVFYNQNDGFLNLYTFIKDCLISNLGVFKTFWEDGKEKREEYENLDPIEAEKILFEDGVELLEHETDEDGMINLVIKRKCPGNVCIDTPAPEEFGISSSASSPNPKDAPFTYHKVEKTVSELIEMGFDRTVVENLVEDDNYGEQRLARRFRSDEQLTDTSIHKSMQKVWVTECYVRVDMNDDGIAELLKVTIGSSKGSEILDYEEVDEVPFATATPIILTHKFYGQSLIDLVVDIQKIRTTLFRGILDNMYLANNVRMGANEKVNIDDLLVSRPGGVVRTEGTDPPGNHISPIVHPPIPGESFGLLEVLDDMLKARTGVGDEVAGLDSKSLANINTGVIAQAYDMARQRIELMARIIAEIGLRPHFEDIRRVLYKKQDRMMQMKINGQWMDVRPTLWRDERRTRVQVGLGHSTREKKLMGISDIMNMQNTMMQTGYKYITPQNIHAAISDRIECHGLEPDKYFMNPATYQPPPEQPPVDLLIKQAELKLDEQKIQIDSQKAQAENQVKIMLAQSREREMETKRQMEEVKGTLQLQRMQVDEQNQVMRAMNDKTRTDFDVYMGERQQQWKEAQETWELELKKQEAKIDEYKAQLESATQLEAKLMDVEQRTTAETMKHIREMMQMFQNAQNEDRARREQILDFIRENGSEKIQSFTKRLN